MGICLFLFVCVDRWTEDNGKKGVSVAVFLCCAGRLCYAVLRAYVAAAHPCPRHCAPTRQHRNNHRGERGYNSI